MTLHEMQAGIFVNCMPIQRLSAIHRGDNRVIFARPFTFYPVAGILARLVVTSRDSSEWLLDSPVPLNKNCFPGMGQ